MINQKKLITLFAEHRKLVVVLIVFGICYSLLSLVNHFLFKTYALDLGAYTNALYDYRNFNFNDSLVFKDSKENLLADHFDLYLIIFAPLSFLFGTYTLLIVQILAVLFGGIGIYKYFNLDQTTKQRAISATLYFFLFFAIYTAIAFDYHSNVVAAMLVPWFFYHIKKKQIKYASIFLILILIGKENMALWMVFICFGSLLLYWKDKRLRFFFSIAIIGCIVYFLLVMNVIMPALSNSGSYAHFDYAHLGGNMKEAIFYLISHPIDAVRTLFVNHTGDATGDYVKLELHLMLLFAGLPFLLKKPQYLIMLIPIFFQKLFHDNTNMWGVANQYSIEFAPIMSIGIFEVINKYKSENVKKWLGIGLTIFSLACTIKVMDSPIAWIKKPNIRIYHKDHYSQNFDAKSVHKDLELIPQNAIVSAQTLLLPHLALRDHVYTFPKVGDATYIVLIQDIHTYPISNDEFNEKLLLLENSTKWEKLTTKSEVYIFHKK